MSLLYSSELIPETKTGAYALLDSAGFEPDRLTEPQRQAIRRLYHLDDERTVEQRLRDGEITILSAGMEDETAAINRLDRGEEQ